jgi:hypothetical protein
MQVQDDKRNTPASDSGSERIRRFERCLLNAVLFVTVSGVILLNMPDSSIKRRLLPTVRPYVTALGLNQAWNLFSPDPSRRSLFVEARLRFADGSIDTLAVPEGDPWIGDKRFYRWRKWQRRVRLDSNRELWPATAIYIGAPYLIDPRGLVSVGLIRRWSETPEPWGAEKRVWQEFEFFELDVRGQALSATGSEESSGE